MNNKAVLDVSVLECFLSQTVMYTSVDSHCVSVCRNLPAKPEEEAQKHRQEYEEMVAQAKKRGDFIFTHLFVPVCPALCSRERCCKS